MDLLKKLPDALTISRLFLAPVLLCGAFVLEHRLGAVFLGAYVIGFLTDVADGKIARALGVANPQSAALDSMCDLVFQGAAITCLISFRPDVISFYFWPFMLAIFTHALHWSAGLIKFGRLPGYHTRWAKTWAVVLFLTIVEASISQTSILMAIALALAIVSTLEEFAITLVLPKYRTDVHDLSEAMEIRSCYRFPTKLVESAAKCPVVPPSRNLY